MTICYYATSHGYGHAVRVSQVIKELPVEVDVIIRTTAPESLFREEIKRPFRYLPAEFDCGCLQSDSVTVLQRETLDRYRDIAERNRAAPPNEVDFLKRERVTCVACDIPSFPLRAAREAGVAGVAISNFTWHDIYREYVSDEPIPRPSPDLRRPNGVACSSRAMSLTPESDGQGRPSYDGMTDQDLLDEMAEEYACATEGLILPLYVPTIQALFPRLRHVPMICRRGVDIRERIDGHLGSRRTPHLALLYIGLWGLDVDWERVAALRDWTFLSYERIAGAPSNVVMLPRDEWPPADVAASVDAVVSKPGYGTISDCIGNGIPFVYIPREGFAEYGPLHEGLMRWGGGVRISVDDFAAGNWAASMDAALVAKPDPSAYAVDGAQVVARILAEYAGAA